jgi:hypothetical protein
MSRRLYIPPFVEYFSFSIQEKSGSDHTDMDLSIVFLLADHAILFVELSRLIRYQLYAEIMLVAELRMRYF